MDISLFLKKNYYFKGTGQIQKLVGKKNNRKGTIEESDKKKCPK